MYIILCPRRESFAQCVQVMGAADPTSGTVSLNEIVRALGVLHEKGWKPLRTILIASWDGEEVYLSCSPLDATQVSPVRSRREYRMGRGFRRLDSGACCCLP